MSSENKPRMFQIKICGITSPEDARAAADAGADALGLNFYPGSPRYVTPDQAQRIVAELPAGIARVGVFVNASEAEIRAIAAHVGLDLLQLHGEESMELLQSLQPWPVVRAFRCQGEADRRVLEYLDQARSRNCLPDAVLLDAYDPAARGGTGRVLNWIGVARLRPQLGRLPLVLAGGLTPENIERAIRQAGPAAVDTASGVERAPGRKDAQRMRDFVRAARAALDASASAAHRSMPFRESTTAPEGPSS
jgi:phosphoribosylanthranilate isomerase